MESGQLDWTSGVAERFTNRLCELLDKKLKDSVNQLQSDLKRSGDNEIAIAQALLAMRRNNIQIYKLASLHVLSEDTKSSTQEMVSNAIQTMQKSLEDSAQRDRTGQMTRLIRNIPIMSDEKKDSPYCSEKENDGQKPKRKVLI
jgi:acyl-CoA thioesterase